MMQGHAGSNEIPVMTRARMRGRVKCRTLHNPASCRHQDGAHAPSLDGDPGRGRAIRPPPGGLTGPSTRPSDCGDCVPRDVASRNHPYGGYNN